MKLLSITILLATIVNLINGRPEIKGADPTQRFHTPTYIEEQERRYATAVKNEGHQYHRPLRTRVITPQTHSYQGSSHRVQYTSAWSSETQYQTRGSSQPVIPQRTDRHERYGNRNQLVTSRPVIPQKTDRHPRVNQDITRNDRLYGAGRADIPLGRSRGLDSAAEELWSTSGGSVKSEVIDTRLRLNRPRHTEGVKG